MTTSSNKEVLISRLESAEDFTCAICERVISMRWNGRGPGTIKPPLCLYCEGLYSQGVGKPSAGALGDRRMVRQGFALSEALRCEAARKSWPDRWWTNAAA